MTPGLTEYVMEEWVLFCGHPGTITVLEHCFEGIKVAVYELIETPEETGLGRCECRLSKITENKGFEDTGHAVAWALAELQ